MTSKQTVEQMEAVSREVTAKELEKLHKEYKNRVDRENQDNSSDSESDNDSIDSQTPKITIKSVEKKRETTMLYMFKKYEQLQNECNQTKNKLYKMRIQLHSEEQKAHYKNLEFSTLLVEKDKLKQDLKTKKYVNFKYYTSFTLNILLTLGIAYLYNTYDI
jgi:hypothetical protein